MLQVGCFLCILGSTIIVIHAPKEGEVESLDVLLDKLQEPSTKKGSMSKTDVSRRI